MANIKSAKKRIKVIEKKTALNRARKSQIKTAIRKFEEAVARFQYAQKRISQVASKGTIHKNAAARKVAKLAQKLNGMNA